MTTIRSYVDALGRTQRAVDGPNGTYLITRGSDREGFQVWKSDSLRASYRTNDPAAALERAVTLAGGVV